jgi:bifunctional non-homologous end joining protein LigD
MDRIFRKLPDDQKDRLKKVKQPEWISSMLAKLTHDHFSSEDWIYERKFDGERCLVFNDGRKVRLMSRNKKELNDTYPELEEAFGKQESDFIVDCEIVSFEGNVTSFSRLQERMKIRNRDEAKKSRVAVYCYLFDILHLDNYDTTGLALRYRKSILRDAIGFSNEIRFTNHRNKEGEKYHREACQKGWEGVIAKNAQSGYVQGRSGQWLKFKCGNQQEFVIGGYTDPKGERVGFGAILIRYYEDDKLRYAGKVGTGYDDETLRDLKKKFKRRRRSTTPFKPDLDVKNVRWIKPDLVAEVGFTEWTDDGKLRHPRYLGLRRDKSAKKVVREG